MGNRFDIVMISDLRLPGGTTASMTEEIRAQAEAGYRTALVHVNSRLSRRRDLGIDPRLRRCLDDGLAELVLPDTPVTARLALLRNATVFESEPHPPLSVSTERVILVTNNVATDAAGNVHFEPASVTRTVEHIFGKRPLWCPIGPAVRRSLEMSVGAIDLADSDWLNLIDVDEWVVDRSEGVHGRRPVLGRHSRPQPSKWPERPDHLLAAYPDSDEFLVRILGGAQAIREVLGRVPRRWIVEEFGARNPQDFIADLDFFVYFHRSDLVEAYGRSIMEALASGAVAILPPHFRETFRDAAIYTEPTGVVEVVRWLSRNRGHYVRQSRRGREFVAEHHGYRIHRNRLASLIGPATSRPISISSRRRHRDRARILFVSSNGAGMGHLTRLLAMARRAGRGIEPFFFSMSQAVPVVGQYGFPWEYCPSRADLDVPIDKWNELFTERFCEIVKRYAPRALVFDGTMPYAGLVASRPMFPGLLYVWMRRGMWRPDTTTRFLDRGSVFDTVIEPGEVATSADRGPTVGRHDAVRVGPITLLDRHELLERADARAELGMDPERSAMLVTLGAGNVNDTRAIECVVADTMRSYPMWDLYTVRAPIAWKGYQASRGSMTPISVYPLARYLKAFDACVAASGYNTFHEVLMAGVPTLYVPNLQTRTDDQQARAEFAEKEGLGLAVADASETVITDGIQRIIDPTEGFAIRERCLAKYPANGAPEAIGIVERLLRLGRRC